MEKEEKIRKQQKETMTIPKSMAKAIIGPRGLRINHIVAESRH